LGLYEEHFLHNKFDYVVGFLNDITSTELFANALYKKHLELRKVSESFSSTHERPKEALPIKDFLKKANEIHISNQLLKLLVEEFYDKDSSTKKK